MDFKVQVDDDVKELVKEAVIVGHRIANAVTRLTDTFRKPEGTQADGAYRNLVEGISNKYEPYNGTDMPKEIWIGVRVAPDNDGLAYWANRVEQAKAALGDVQRLEREAERRRSKARQ